MNAKTPRTAAITSTFTNRRAVRRTAAALAVTIVPIVGIAGAGTANAATPPTPAGNNNSYSLTQTVINNSTQTLTLTSIRTDNGAVIQTGYPITIAPNGGTATYAVTNHGNGAQLWIDFTGNMGAKVTVDSDVPKISSNWSNNEVTANGAIAAAFSMSKGNNATASFTIDAARTNGTQSSWMPTDVGPMIARPTSAAGGSPLTLN